MKSNTSMIARSALLTALATAIMYISTIVPSAKVALVALAGIVSCIAVVSCGTAWACYVFVITACLSLLILPLKSCAVLYAVFLGWYPILKSVIERHIKRTAIQWVIKLAVFNISFSLLLLLAKQALFDGGFPEGLHGWMIVAAYVVLNFAFSAYDIVLTRLIPIYINRIAMKIFKQGGK